MKDITIRYLQNENLLEEHNESLTFANRFKREDIANNEHFLLPNKELILQVNHKYASIGCHDKGFNRLRGVKLVRSTITEMVKNLLTEGKQVHLSAIGDHDYVYEELEDLGLDKLGQRESGVQNDIKLFEENVDYIYQAVSSFKVRTLEYTLTIYLSGSVNYSKHGTNNLTAEDVKNFITYLGKLSGMYDSYESLEPILMLEKEIVKHPLSDLHVLMDYLNNHQNELPETVQDVLKGGLADKLNNDAETYKNKQVYK